MKNQFKTKIREIREANELFSQKSLAERLEVAQSTIGNWEAGTREPPYDTLIRIADEFKVSTDYLLGHQVFPDSNPDTNVDMHRVAELREKKGLTVSQLAEKVAIPTEELIKIESGKSNPPANVIMKLSEALFSTPTDLLGYLWHTEPFSPIFNHSGIQKLIRLCEELNPEGLEKLIDSADDMVRSGKYKKYNPDSLGKKEA